MTYRQAILAAIASWEGIWFHVNKSVQSENAVNILHRLMGDDPRYDDRLHRAVEWFLGRSQVQFTYSTIRYDALSTTSALYRKLTDALRGADAPLLQPSPVVSSSVPRSSLARVTTPTPPSSSSRAPSSVVPSSTVRTPSSMVAPSSTRTVSPTLATPSRAPSSGASSSSLRPSSSGVLPFSRHFGEWKAVEITDIPTAHHGRYDTRPDDFHAINQRGSAQMIAQQVKGLGKKDKVDEFAEYWIEIGRLIMKSKKKVGRCFSCSGIAVYTLVKEREHDNWVILVVGNPSRDHYFVLVGASLEAIRAKDGYVIDIWDGNLSGTPPVHPIKGFKYMDKHVIPCCLIMPEDREKLRTFIRDRESGAD